ncbi:hypothetical protein DNTS_003103 [Danionella cerebrum]|uniref:Selenoprotein O n=1 Tax=Danionella cerebrum TaxID=2873325 RepID=A0A553N0E7_9TELE|nr:hypothetical protein DNTS_003103 [Danionella translucida]
MAQTPLESLKFNNVALKALPVDSSLEPGSRIVEAACFSRVHPQPLLNPSIVALSEQALGLLGLNLDGVLKDPHAVEYLSGSRCIPGSEPAAHCYSGHQFGQFGGQLGDGAVCYLGEVETGHGKASVPGSMNPCGRWEIQVKGAGPTPYSRGSDGRKVLRSSIREFLCSEAMFALGIPTTRAGSLVTSDLFVQRDEFNSGNLKSERCSVVLRIAPTFIRFGSFEIFLPVDDLTGRQGPSAGRTDIRAQLLDYVIETFFPDVQGRHSERHERNAAFFREVAVRTAKLCAQWQSVGFCHGVLNTDNMSILGLTIDYGPFGFMDRFDPEFVCNVSDKRRRYSYEAQPYVCRWNLVRLAEALGSEIKPASAGAILDEFTSIYEDFYLSIMRRKLGLLRKQEAEDEALVADLLKTMHITGADFTNTFRLLSGVSSTTGEGDSVAELIRDQCASLEELKMANHPTMEPGELESILFMAETNPGMFSFVANKPEVAKQLEKIGRLRELLTISEEELKTKQREHWESWIKQYRKRLARECDVTADPDAADQERVQCMNSTNPAVVLRNYIAQNAIEAAERGDFSEVQRVLKILESPYSFGMDLERHSGRINPKQEVMENTDETHQIPYDSKPPAWATSIFVT